MRPGRLTMEYSDDGESSLARPSSTGAAAAANGSGRCSLTGVAVMHVVAEGVGEEAAGASGELPTTGEAFARQRRLSLASALAALAQELQQQLAVLEGEVPLRQLYGRQPAAQPQGEQQAEGTAGGASAAGAPHVRTAHGSPGLLGLAGPGRGAARQQLGLPPAWPPPPAHVVARARAASAAARTAQQATAPGAPPAGADGLLLERSASLRRMSSVLRRMSSALLPSRAARAAGAPGEDQPAQLPPLWRDNLAGRDSEADAGHSALRRFSTVLRRFSAALLVPRNRLSASSSSNSTDAEPAAGPAPAWHSNAAAARASTVQAAPDQRITLRRMSSVAKRLFPPAFFPPALSTQQPAAWQSSQPGPTGPSDEGHEGRRPTVGMPAPVTAAGHAPPAPGGTTPPPAAQPLQPPPWRSNFIASRASTLVAEERAPLRRMSSVLRRLSSALLPQWVRLPAEGSSSGEAAGPSAGGSSRASAAQEEQQQPVWRNNSAVPGANLNTSFL